MRGSRARSRRALGFAVAAVCVACAAPAVANAGFSTGLWGSGYTSTDPSVRAQEFDWAREASAKFARIDVSWRAITSGQPGQPANPADPAYDFTRIDDAVRDASARGLKVVLTVYRAPGFAQAPGADGDTNGTWKPNPGAFGEFATAIATRYSGGFNGLPAVRYYEAWNEPNLFAFLTPQKRKGFRAANHYRRMVNAFSKGVKGVRGNNKVIAGATAPYGDDDASLRTRPLAFLRQFMCLRKKGGKLRRGKCKGPKARFDVLSHHPINLSGGPRRSAIHRDDASTPDLKHVRRTLRGAERLNTVKGKRHPVWATELWWESKPPEPGGVSLRRHAKWTSESLYVLWRQGAKVVINFGIRDQPVGNTDLTIDSGLVHADGTKKPAFGAFRFPFVLDRKRSGKVLAWGKAPSGGKLKIQRKRGKGKWRAIASKRVRPNQVFRKNLGKIKRIRLRAVVGGEASMAWRAPKR